MAIDASKVYVGTPDQLTTGAIMCAPVGTKTPELEGITPSGVTIDNAFKDAGYASSDGLTITTDNSTNDITDWSGGLVRRVLESSTVEMSWTMIQIDEQSFKMSFGDDYVTAVAATAAHGNQLKAAIGAHLPDRKAWVFKMKDGAARVLVVVPCGQVTSLDDITFNATDPIGLAVTLSCYNDSKGNALYILTDDGQLSTVKGKE